MTLEGIFSGASALAMIGWIALALAPIKRPWCIAFARILALVLAAAYLGQYFLTTEPVEGANFSTLAGVTALFSKAGNLMLGWTHYLAFDLFIGSWEVEDGEREGIPHWVLLPCLGLTLFFGPMGLLLYFAIRTAKRQFMRPA